MIIKNSASFEHRNFQLVLGERNVETRAVFTGNVTRQPGFKNLEMWNSNSVVNADNLMRGGV